jgi:hypothetical protein
VGDFSPAGGEDFVFAANAADPIEVARVMTS